MLSCKQHKTSRVDEQGPPTQNLIKTCPMSQNYEVKQLLLLNYLENCEPCGKVYSALNVCFTLLTNFVQKTALHFGFLICLFFNPEHSSEMFL
jgi:hypothetical protein